MNGRQFILTHAAPAELYETYGRKYECERDFAVWMRFDSFPVLEDCTVIFGHTPTIRFQYDNPMAIWDAKSWIGIDCGCMLPEKGDSWSGALGNFIDRVRQGYVVDFFYFSLINFPIFNVADIYIVVGTILLILLIFFYYKEEDLNVIFKKKQ